MIKEKLDLLTHIQSCAVNCVKQKSRKTSSVKDPIKMTLLFLKSLTDCVFMDATYLKLVQTLHSRGEAETAHIAGKWRLPVLNRTTQKY